MNEKYIKTPNNYLKDVTGVYGEGNLEMLVRDGNKLALQFKSRIEGRTRDADPTEAMRLRVHDPLWMLARQWQMGEFRGNNTGTAMSVRCIVRYEDCSSDPIEPVTEQINPRIDFLAKIESAVHFLDLMRSSGMKVKEHLPGLIQSFPIDWNALDDSLVLPDAVTSQQEHLLNRHLQNYARAYRGKIFDGEALYNHLVQGHSFLNGDSDEPETKFKAWFQKKYKPVSSDSQSWQEADLCYTVETNVAGKQFTGDRYQGGRLSWYTFDYDFNPGDKSFGVFLKNNGPQKLQVLKKIKELLNIGLKEAKDFIDSAPVTLIEGITEAEAKAIQSELIDAGADVVLIGQKQNAEEEPRVEEDNSFAIFLKNPGPQNVQVINRIKELLGIGLEEAKGIVDRAPVIIKQGMTEAEAKAIHAELIALDADVEVRVPKQRTGERPRTGTRPGDETCISFALFLQNPGSQKLQVIKKTNELLKIGLKDAKDLVDRAPVALKEGMTEAEAKAIQTELITLGAEVELIKVQRPRTGTSPRPRDEEGILFGLLLKDPGPQKIKVIKKTNELLKIGLKDAKDLVDRAPVILKEGMTKAEAKAIQSELIALGADVELTDQKQNTEEEPRVDEDKSFGVVLKSVGLEKPYVFGKLVKLLKLEAKAAQALVDSAPVTVKDGITEAEAESIHAQLFAVGADVELICQKQTTKTRPGDNGKDKSFGVVLKSVANENQGVITKVSFLLKIGLKSAENLVSSAPVTIIDGITEVMAKAIQKELSFSDTDVEVICQKPTTDVKPGGTEETLIRKEEVLCLPTPASFAAAPNKRLWQMEDRKVFMGNSVEEPSEANSVVMRFATMYSNDWMLFPLKTEIGQYITIERIDVIDSFGQRHTMSGNCRAGNKEQLGEYEEQWQVFVNSTVGDAKRTAINGLYYAQQLAATIEGKPVEEIKILRDEIANMVWGVENIVSDGCGGTLDANLYATQLETIVNERNKAGEPVREPDTIVFGQDSAPEVEKAADNQAPRAKFSYSLQSSVPFNWIPFIPQRLATEDTKKSPFFMGGREIILRRGKMPCYIFNGNKFDLHAVRPQSSIMRPVVTRDKNGNVLKEEPMVIHEEAVQATGIRLTKNYQRARWIGGKTYQWLGVHKRQSRTEASSGLVFDKLKEV